MTLKRSKEAEGANVTKACDDYEREKHLFKTMERRLFKLTAVGLNAKDNEPEANFSCFTGRR
jgi:hypothetical protein